MWIFMNDAMLSIVEYRNEPDYLLVRARNGGDIERVFPLVETYVDINADYRHRADVPRAMVAKAISDRISNIGYDNFKNSIPPHEHERHYAYTDVWAAMLEYQCRDDPKRHSPIPGLGLPRLNENNKLEI